MPRNLFRRIELACPIEDGALRERLIRQVLAVSLEDNTKARLLGRDGSYRIAKPARGEKPIRSQWKFMAMATAEEDHHATSRAGKSRFPKVTLAASPFTMRKPRR